MVRIDALDWGEIFTGKEAVIKFIFLGRSRKMAVYDVEFVFSCSCFTDILSVTLNWGTQKNFEVDCFLYHNTDKKKNYQTENFLEAKSLFVSCFWPSLR